MHINAGIIFCIQQNQMYKRKNFQEKVKIKALKTFYLEPTNCQIFKLNFHSDFGTFFEFI